MKVFTLLLLAFVVTNSALALDISYVKKDYMSGMAFKVGDLRVEYIAGKKSVSNIYPSAHGGGSEVVNSETQRKETSVSFEPEYKIFEYSKFNISINPLIGLSTRSVSELEPSEVGLACYDPNTPSLIADPKCFANKETISTNIITGASLKFDIETSNDLHFYVKGGAYSNGDGYKSQASFGVTLPF